MTRARDDVRLVAVLSPAPARTLADALRIVADAGVSTVMAPLGGAPARAARLPFELSDFDGGASATVPPLTRAEVEALVAAASSRDVEIVLPIATAEHVALARGAGAAAWHLAASALLDLPFIAAVAGEGVPLWIDTAMAAIDEVADAVGTALKAGTRALLLQSLITTPARPDEVNLRALVTLRERFGLPVGWHAREATPALVSAAVALGARVVAVPFDAEGRTGGDAATLRAIAGDVALVSRALGDGDKRVQPSEWAERDRAHPSLIARVDIARGHTVTAEMLGTAPPGIGLKPRAANGVVGRRAVVDIAAGTLITLGMLE